MNDDELRNRFADLRDEDARRAPGFNTAWQGAVRLQEAPAASPLRPWLRYALPAAALLLAAATLPFLANRPAPPAGKHVEIPFDTLHAAVADRFVDTPFAGWESPTAYLLDPPILLYPPETLRLP